MNALAITLLIAVPVLFVAIGEVIKLWAFRRSGERRPRPVTTPVREVRERKTRAA